LCHGGAKPSHLFTIPFIADIFGQLGLTAGDFVHFDRPTRMRELTVSCPAFEEQHFIHRAFGELCQRIGHSILAGRDLGRVMRPAYLSKTRMRSGVGHFVNEKELANALDNAGFDIVYPEELSFREQVELFATRDVVGRQRRIGLAYQHFCENAVNHHRGQPHS
jgi:capsular polysaccharide biosynthesis protein